MTSISLLERTLARMLGSPYTIVALAISSYLLLVRCLRNRRAEKIKAGWGDGPGERALSSMTGEDAFKILLELQELEFPAAFHKARAVALLKVWASYVFPWHFYLNCVFPLSELQYLLQRQ